MLALGVCGRSSASKPFACTQMASSELVMSRGKRFEFARRLFVLLRFAGKT